MLERLENDAFDLNGMVTAERNDHGPLSPVRNVCPINQVSMLIHLDSLLGSPSSTKVTSDA